MEGVDEGLAVVEVDVEGALRDAGLGDDAVDAEAGEPVLLGDDDAGVEQRLARAVPDGGGGFGGHARRGYLTGRSPDMTDRSVIC